ncbi:phenylalanine ammonia-lyase [Fomitiporia mediterranea MF3/22]|uniref:phenylalanine ammonia-lyase n=1 Tax=Fomitiporia mediterranea (strain MF3/22) TaxID=694068 RepID=UPI00044095D5|nr:phenylalanine ammonia-lyase [Fomitiporia mediterranea MF3/22]EJD08070.1 phenylalanine ammonia-lyase [Fomitiporia mediterranea MF3/22]
MVVNSDSFSHRSYSGSTTIVSPRHESPSVAFPPPPVDPLPHHPSETSIPLRVPTPEDDARYNALLERAACLRDFVAHYHELEAYKNGAPITLTGEGLTLPAVSAVARYPDEVSAAIDDALAQLSKDTARIEHLQRSRTIIDDKLAQNKSIYGVSTGFGGSADTRTAEHDSLGLALLQHQHAGVLPTALESLADSNSNASSTKSSLKKASKAPLPLSSSISDLSMPASWTRAALLIRLNSLLRGHSAASLPLLNSMGGLLSKQITPVVPLRGSISASGDLSPLSYIAGTLIGERGIYCYAPSSEGDAGAMGMGMGMAGENMKILRAPDALKAAGLEPISLRPKEQLAILNGTAFSCAAAALCVEEARQLIMLGTVCTAMGTEAMRGSVDSFAEFIHRIRPHPGQIETGALLTHLLEKSKLATRHSEPTTSTTFTVAESGKDVLMAGVEEETIDADAGVLRQDRYPLRTAPQWIGPQLETVMHSAETIAIECNSTTDNPLIDPDTGIVHHGGNFQAMSLTSSLEPLRLAIFHIGKLLFAQATELQNPLMSNGLAGNLAATSPSLNFFGKGIDIAMAAYVAELGYLANPVSTNVQSAEMHNQAVNSLALLSARYTLQAIEVLQMIVASYIILLCQAVDLRAIQKIMEEKTTEIVAELVKEYFTGVEVDVKEVIKAVWTSFDTSANMDARPRCEKASKASTQPLIESLLSSSSSSASSAAVLTALPAFQSTLTSTLHSEYTTLTNSFLTSSLSPSSSHYLPASSLLGRTKALYQFVRSDLGVGMHGLENSGNFPNGLGHSLFASENDGEEKRGRTIGGEVAIVYEAIRDGRMKSVLVGMFGRD